ncbi:MAG: hypothetical protein AAFR61_15645 [Bacteroidota bacterium]
MKTFVKPIFAAFALVAFLGFSEANAQKISATLNLSQFHIDDVTDGTTNINYTGSSSASLNFRYYTKNKWAYRFGGGIDNLSYTVGDGINTDYSARRQDLKGIFGIEKHFIIANFLDIYPGAYVPITITGDDIIEQNYDNIQNGDLRAGLGVLLGANFKFLKIFRFGVEFDATYDDFKAGVWEGAQNLSLVPIQGINHNTSFTLGIAF